jgi:hypothetical protein
MVGIDSLPNRQRQAFELICLRGYTESAATAILLPNSRWSTPVQQYSDDGLKKMIAAYDARQDGTWDPLAVRRKRRKKACKDTPEGQEFTAAPGQDCSLPSENEKGLESAPTDTGEESGV